MKYGGYTLIIILGLALQSFWPGFAFLGFRPDLILLLTLIFGMLGARGGAGIFGFVGGLLQDFLIGQFIGLYAGICALIGILVSFVAKRLYKENLLVRFFVIFLGTFLGQTLYLFGAASFGFSSPLLLWNTWFKIIGTSFFNGIVGMILYRPLVDLNKRLLYLDELLKRTG